MNIINDETIFIEDTMKLFSPPFSDSSTDTKSHAATSFGNHLLAALQSAGKLTPYVVLGSTILALLYPPSFSWFTNK